MYTLSCYCELTPFRRLLKYSLTPSIAHQTHYPASGLVQHDVVGFCIALYNDSPVCVQVQMSRGSFDFTQIAIPNQSPNVFFSSTFGSFILLHLYDSAVSLWKSCGLIRMNGKQFIAYICIEMVKMKIINLHIKCKKLVIQKCGKITLNIWNVVVFILNFFFVCFSIAALRVIMDLHCIESFQFRLEFT